MREGGSEKVSEQGRREGDQEVSTSTPVVPLTIGSDYSDDL